MFAKIWCLLFHSRYVMRLPGHEGNEAQCMCELCGLMWLEDRPDLWNGPWIEQSNADHTVPRS